MSESYSNQRMQPRGNGTEKLYSKLVIIAVVWSHTSEYWIPLQINRATQQQSQHGVNGCVSRLYIRTLEINENISRQWIQMLTSRTLKDWDKFSTNAVIYRL